MSLPRKILFSALGLIVIVVALFTLLFLVTGNNTPVAVTISDDPSLPAIEINGIKLHAQSFGDTARSISQADLGRLAPETPLNTPVLFLAGACNTWIGAPLQRQHLERFQDKWPRLSGSKTQQNKDLEHRF